MILEESGINKVFENLCSNDGMERIYFAGGGMPFLVEKPYDFVRILSDEAMDGQKMDPETKFKLTFIAADLCFILMQREMRKEQLRWLLNRAILHYIDLGSGLQVQLKYRELENLIDSRLSICQAYDMFLSKE